MSQNASRFARWGFALALLPIAACSTPTPAPVASTPPAPPPLADQDSTFVNQATMGNLAEIQDGQLAAKQAMRPAVKSFGQSMVTDHTQANQQLASIASGKGVTPPTAPSDSEQAMMTKLSAMHGRAFDTAYLRGQIAGHEQMVALLQTEISQGTDPDLKSFAQTMLPIVQKHLEMARSLMGMKSTPATTTRKHHS